MQRQAGLPLPARPQPADSQQCFAFFFQFQLALSDCHLLCYLCCSHAHLALGMFYSSLPSCCSLQFHSLHPFDLYAKGNPSQIASHRSELEGKSRDSINVFRNRNGKLEAQSRAHEEASRKRGRIRHDGEGGQCCAECSHACSAALATMASRQLQRPLVPPLTGSASAASDTGLPSSSLTAPGTFAPPARRACWPQSA